MNQIFNSIVTAVPGSAIDVVDVLICMAVALVLGALFAITYVKTELNYKKSLAYGLVLFPMVVTAVISLVNGSVGAGIAVAGSFALIRFRSEPASAKEIAFIYAAMAVGLAAATGYIFFTVVFAVIVMIIMVILRLIRFGEEENRERELKISISESVDYETAFTEVFEKYLDRVTFEKIKASNKGSVYELKYHVVIKKNINEKDLLEAVLEMNDNLPVSIGKP